MADLPLEDHFVTSITEDHVAKCWGCGLRLLLPSNAPIFKCGWCGAITNQNLCKPEGKLLWWRQFRDRCFVCVLLLFILFVICGGVWAVYPVVFKSSYFGGVFHSIVTFILSVTTISMFSLAAFRCAGTPPTISWGSYPVVGKGGLGNYAFCHYCLKPKSPRTHHCRSCGTCILDMDHHCPFIGNCVGAANHRYFIAFLISAIISTIYASVLSAYAGFHIWPPLTYGSLRHANGSHISFGLRIAKETVISFLSSAVLLSARGVILIYLFVASVSVQIGLSVLLWQQLCFIYEGKTYLSSLTSKDEEDEVGERDCQNLIRFFGFPYSTVKFLPTRNCKKSHDK